MYSKYSNLVLGFHGCDESLRNDVINGSKNLIFSQNKYDWLGNGIYFWENNPKRALEYAEMLKINPTKSKGSIKSPAVLGAVIDLGNCLDLLIWNC